MSHECEAVNPYKVFIKFSVQVALGTIKFPLKAQIQWKNNSFSDDKMKVEGALFKDGKLDRASLVRFVKEVKKHEGLTDEDAALLAASK